MKNITVVFENIESKKDIILASQAIASYYSRLVKGNIHSVINLGKNYRIEVLSCEEDIVKIKSLGCFTKNGSFSSTGSKTLIFTELQANK